MGERVGERMIFKEEYAFVFSQAVDILRVEEAVHDEEELLSF